MKTLSTLAFVVFTAAGALAQSPPGYQWIHVAADPSLSEGIWFCKNGIPVGPASFESAIGFITDGIPASHVFSIGTDQSCAQSLAAERVTSTEDAFYQFLALGVVDEAAFAPNPDGIPTKLRLAVNGRARLETPVDSVGLTFVHAITDAPALKVRVIELGLVYELGSFGTAVPHLLASSSGLITFELFEQSDAEFENLIAIRRIDVTELDGRSVTLVATGFLDPGENRDGPGVNVIAVHVDGESESLFGPVVMVELVLGIDMSAQIRNGHFDPASELVVVAGDFNGWDTTADTLAPIDDKSGIYSKTIRIDSVLTPTELEYKFVIGQLGMGTPSRWESIENRKISVKGIERDLNGDGYLEIAMPELPYFDDAGLDSFFLRDVDVTFTVDARPAFYFLADSGWVPSDPQSGERIDTFSGVFVNGPLSLIPDGWAAWGRDSLGARTDYQLVDDGTSGDVVAGDSVYTWLRSYAEGDRRDGPIKFSLEGFDNEAIAGINHRIAIPADGATARVDLVFGAMEDGAGGFHDDMYDPYILVQRRGSTVFAATVRDGGDVQEPAIEPVDVEIAFAVDMSIQMRLGYFNPDSHLVVVAGSYNDWDTTVDTLAPGLTDPRIYAKTVLLHDVAAPAEIEYKYATGLVGGEAPDDFESGSDRILTITGDEPDTDGDGYLEIAQEEKLPYFNQDTPEDFFSRDVNVVFSVDLRPAFYLLADSGWVPAGILNGERVDTFSGVWINGPLAKTPNGWENWGPSELGLLTEFQFFDDGVDPDRVAGDTLYSWSQSYILGDRRTGSVRFGLDGYNNEGVPFADHVLSLPEHAAETTVELIFGAMEAGNGNYSDDLYDPYILLTWESEDVIVPVVVRRGGDQGDTAIDVEEIANAVPTEVTLSDNYPNPFNPTTTIEYAVDEPQQVRIDVYDMTGRRVTTLVNRERVAGTYRATFDATGLSSGVYIYRLVAGGKAISKKMLVLR